MGRDLSAHGRDRASGTATACIVVRDAFPAGNERLRVSVSVQALPVVLSLDPSALRALIRGVVTHAAPALPEPPAQPASAAAAGEVPDGTAALISVLRAARQLQLVAGLDALAGCKRALGVDIVQVRSR